MYTSGDSSYFSFFLVCSLLFFFQKPLTPVTSNHATGWAFPFAAITPGYTRLWAPTTPHTSWAVAGNAPAMTSRFIAEQGNTFLDLLLSHMRERERVSLYDWCFKECLISHTGAMSNSFGFTPCLRSCSRVQIKSFYYKKNLKTTLWFNIKPADLKVHWKTWWNASFRVRQMRH